MLADDAGVGKTGQAVRACDLAQIRHVGVLAPAAVRNHWGNEFLKWQQRDRRIDVVEGYPTQVSNADVVVYSHDCLSRDQVAAVVAQNNFDALIVDEAHQMRNFEAHRTAALAGGMGLAIYPRYTWWLTGTPVVNSAGDLYPFLHAAWIREGIMPPSWWDFCGKFASIVPDGFHGYKPVGVQNIDQLAGLLRSIFLRRTLDDAGVVLPPLTQSPVSLQLPKGAVATILAALSNWTPEKLQQVLESQDEIHDAAISRARRALGTAKIPQTAAGLSNILRNGGGPVVAFFIHTDVRTGVTEKLIQEGWRVGWIDGKITQKVSRRQQQALQDGELDVLMVQIQSGGMGLTLTRANRVVMVELPWTAAALWQAIKRVHRLTQVRPVHADILLAADCWLDEVLMAVIKSKDLISRKILDELKQPANQMLSLPIA